MMNKLLYLAYLAASSEDEMQNSPFFGVFSGAQRTIGIVLLVTGVLIVYFGIKVNMGYKFLDNAGETIVKEDNFEETRAVVGERKATLMPDFGGGEDREFIEYDIAYAVNGKTYIHTIPDGEYKTGDAIKLRYDPSDPDNFYLCSDEDDPSDEQEEQPEQSKNITAIMILAAGVLLIAVGIGLII